MAGAAVSVLVVPSGLAIAVLVGLLVASLVDAWTVRAVPEVDRQVPDFLSRGVPASLRVTPRRPWPGIRLRQPLADAGLRISPQEAAGALDAEIVALRRGRHSLPPVATRVVGPLGLGAWYHRSGGTGQIIVYPDLPAARRLALEVRVGRFREEGRRSRGPIGLGTDLESIREYQPDDDIRQVNWAATARTGTPMSNTYRVEQDRDVVCLIDCGRLMAAPVPGPDGLPRTRLDAAVDAAAAVAAVTEEVGDRMGLVAFGATLLRTVPPRRGRTDLLLHALHDLEPSGVDADYEAAFRAVARARRALVLVFTDLLDERAGEPLVRALPLLSRRHAVVVAGVRDEDVHRTVTTPAETVDEALQTAVAVTLLEARDRLVSRVARGGAEVIDAPVGALSARCVAAYLRAKRRARI